MTPVSPSDQADQAATGLAAVPPQPAAGADASGPGAAPTGVRGAHRRLWIAGAVAVVLAVAGGGWTWAAAGEVPRGTRVLGVDLGTLSKKAAAVALTSGLGARLNRPAQAKLGTRVVDLKLDEVGLTLDTAATIDTAAKGKPRLWGYRDVDPVITVDPVKLDAVLRKQLDPAQTTIKNAGIAYDGLTAKPTYPETGRDLDPAHSADLVRRGWLIQDPIEITLADRTPATTRAQVDELIRTLAAPAVAAPVSVTTPRGTFTLTPEAIAKSLVFTADAAGTLTPAIDEKKFREAAKGGLAQVEAAPAEAKIDLSGGTPKIVAGTPGARLDFPAFAADLLAVLAKPVPRQVTGKLVGTAPSTSDKDLAALGIKEKVSTFTTEFPGGLSSPRSRNIVTIAEEVDGALVKPGETFSLNGHTGERGYAQGYQDAPVIIDGKLTPGVGGGASQFTTTLFNASYYAGLEDVEHKPHSFYFSRYPEVIESTIFYPSLDLRFKNTTPYGILIDTSYTDSSVTVAMWSTRYYDSVTSEKGPRRNITQPPTVHRDDGDKCIATDGLPGFSMDVFRVIRKDGKEVKREKFSWKYDPEPRFVCN